MNASERREHDPECVNPRHLEPVTLNVNTARGVGKGSRALRENICRNGHPFTPENTHVRSDGARLCRACARIRTAAHRAKKAAQ